MYSLATHYLTSSFNSILSYVVSVCTVYHMLIMHTVKLPQDAFVFRRRIHGRSYLTVVCSCKILTVHQWTSNPEIKHCNITCS